MARIFITGSTHGLGLATARTLLNEGREVLLHAGVYLSPGRIATPGGHSRTPWVECRSAQAGFDKLYVGVGIENHETRRLGSVIVWVLDPLAETPTTTY